MQTSTIDRRIANVVEAASLIARATSPDGGLCLPVTAALAHTLHKAGIDVVAVCGSYEGAAHWWVRCGAWYLDPTASQFHDGPMIFPVTLASGYDIETEFPPGWTREHVVLEARRALYFVEDADQFGEELLRMLDMAVDGAA